MLNKEINIPSFKIWKLIVFALLIALGIINLLQWNSTAELRFKNKELANTIEISQDSIKAYKEKIKGLDKLIVGQDTIIKKYKAKKSEYINKAYYYKKQRDEILNDYNNLNRPQRFQSTKELLHE